MKYWSFLVLLFILLVANTGIAQVSGKVFDENGDPLIGASVVFKNTTKGVTTNASGYFNLAQTPDTFTLVISYVGSKTKFVAVKEMQN